MRIAYPVVILMYPCKHSGVGSIASCCFMKINQLCPEKGYLQLLNWNKVVNNFRLLKPLYIKTFYV